MAEYLFKGILIGLLFGLPVGAVGAMTVKNSWAFGFKAGIITGLGSTASDCIYSIVGAFGLTLISDFILKYGTQISVIGGVFIIYMGISALTNKLDKTDIKVNSGINKFKMFFSSLLTGITNPAAVLTFIFAFSYFGISDIKRGCDGGCLVLGVFTGTLIWWVLLSGITCFVKKRSGIENLCFMNKIFGSILILFGIIIFIRILF